MNTYTAERTLADRMSSKLKELRMSIQEAAMKIGYSRTALSRYLAGKYESDPTELENRIREFLKAAGEQEEELEAEDVELPAIRKEEFKPQPKKIKYYESRDYTQTIGVCHACQENAALGIIVGKTGYGKTHVLKQYAKLPRVAYVECDDTMACRDLVEAIETQLGMPRACGGTIWSRVNRIREFFNINEGYLLIIDEADKLINKYTQKKMEILRGILDQSEVGVVIAGEPRLESEIKGSLARFANRVDFYYRLKGLSKQEVTEYLNAFDIDDDAMNEFIARATNSQSGCFRLLDRTLNNALRILKEKKTTEITMKVMSEASNMMML